MTVQVDIMKEPTFQTEAKTATSRHLKYRSDIVQNRLTKDTASSRRKKTQSFMDPEKDRREIIRRNQSKGTFNNKQFQTLSRNNDLEGLKSTKNKSKNKIMITSVALLDEVSSQTITLNPEVSFILLNA